jgi:phosphoribosylanthranilate isomerase
VAVALGADALGLVSAMPSGPGLIDEAEIAAIAAQVPPTITTFLLTSRRSAGEIIEQHRRCRTNALQLVDRVAPSVYSRLREALPGVSIVQVVHVVDEDAIEQARAVSEEVDALLLDSGDPHAPTRQLGGTGRTHDWATSRAIRDAVGVPVFLAGGLRPANVAGAVRRVRPFGVDVCSALRVDGRLDPSRLSAFAAELDRSGG